MTNKIVLLLAVVLLVVQVGSYVGLRQTYYNDCLTAYEDYASRGFDFGFDPMDTYYAEEYEDSVCQKERTFTGMFWGGCLVIWSGLGGWLIISRRRVQKFPTPDTQGGSGK